ncbi:MAG: hypothetical protein OXG35_03365, partial [Acidobacteria bacterium]|nr:hypothetical protein [Acidobacteriota bacterium]
RKWPGWAPASASAQFGPQAYVHAELDVEDSTALAFSPNDRFLAVGDDDGRVYVFDVEAAREMRRMRPARSRIVGLEFSPDGSALFLAQENRGIAEVDLLSGSVGRSQRTEERVRAFDVSPDGRWILWAGDDGMVELLNSRFRRQDVFESPNLYRRRVAFTAFGIEGSEVFAASRDNARSAFWALGEDDPIRRDERNREEYTAFATDHDGELLALAVKAIRLERSAASRGAIAASARNEVRILDWNRGRVVRELEALPDEVRALAISPDRSMVAIAFDDGGMEGYSTQESRQIMSIHDGDRVNVAQFSPTGGWLAAGLDREGVLIWEMSGASAPRATRNVVQQGDVLGQSARYEFTTGSEPLITTFDRFTMAVLDLDNPGVDASLAASALNLVVSRLANVPYIDLVERGDVQQVIDELRLQNTGITSARDAAEIGRILNAQNVLLGNVNQLGSSVTIAVRLVETESARVLGAREILCRRCNPEDLPQAISLLVGSLVEMP